MKARVLLVVLVGLVGGWLPTPAGAQQRIVINGSIQWIDGSRMQVMADSGYSINVSLDQIAQDEYNTMRGGDRIRIYGVVPPDRRRVIAERIERGPNIYDNYPEFPQSACSTAEGVTCSAMEPRAQSRRGVRDGTRRPRVAPVDGVGVPA